MFGLILLINPYQFGGMNPVNLGVFFISLVLLSAIIPLIAILMMYGLGMVQDLELSYHKDRIGPMIVTTTCYCWLLINFYRSGYIPNVFTSFMLGTVLALFFSFLLNLFEKISLHAVGIAGLVTGGISFIFQSGYIYMNFQIGGASYQINNLFICLVLVLILGMVCSSRLILKAHTLREVYGGLLVGVFTQIIALRLL